MSYSMSAPEPTEEDMCGSNAHDISGFINPDTGWRECMCGLFTEPAEGEPHDEYSALQADLIDRYIDGLSKTIIGDATYVNIRTARLRVTLAPVLAGKSQQYLRLLLDSLSASNDLDALDYYRVSVERRMDRAVTLGVHLGSEWDVPLDTVLDFFPHDAEPTPAGAVTPAYSFRTGKQIIINEKNVTMARTVAGLCNLFGGYPRRYTGYLPEEALMTVCPLLEHRQDLIPAAAAILRSQGLSKASTARIVEMIESGEDRVQQGLVEGLL